jgi:uncharacterized damage-inducible protein DinB
MTNREFCLDRRRKERKAFVNVLKAVPQDRLDYRPDPKARTAVELADLLAYEEEVLRRLVETGRAEWSEARPPALRIDEIVARFERSAAGVDERIAALDDAAWEKPVALSMGGTPWEDTTSNFVWGFLFDALHHRGQLTTYLRPMGGKVPAIYGPSADDPGR